MCRGRKSKLTPEVQERIVKAIATGCPYETAFQHAGIAISTGFRWLAEGKDEGAEKKKREFSEAVEKAYADAELAAIARIVKAGQGGQEVKKKIIRKYDKDGNLVSETEEHELTAPQWQADAWRLERTRSEKYGRRDKLQHSGDKENPVVVETDVSGLSMQQLAVLGTVAQQVEQQTKKDAR